MNKLALGLICLISILVFSCTSETDLPFEPGGVFDQAPEELLGNWVAAYTSEELLIAEKSIIWQGQEYEIFSGHPLVKVTRVVAAAGKDTIAVYADDIKDKTFSAAVYHGTRLPLDENGEIPRDDLRQFSRWYYPLGEKYPPVGTNWTYSYYHFRESGHGDDYHGYYEAIGSVLLEVLQSESSLDGSLQIKKTVAIDTMENHYWGRTWDENDSVVRIDSSLTNYVLSEDVYSLYYSNDTLFLVQDSTDLVVSPLRVANNSRIYMLLFSTNNDSYLAYRDIKLERKKGITEIKYEDSYYGITVRAFEFEMKLLDFQPGR